jgi:hypothetical protein
MTQVVGLEALSSKDYQEKDWALPTPKTLPASDLQVSCLYSFLETGCHCVVHDLKLMLLLPQAS